jgi:hypothetical protein
MAQYNLSNIENSTNLLETFVEINSTLNILPFTIFLSLFFIAVLIYANNRAMNTYDSFLAASFATTIIASLGFLAGLASYTIVAFVIVLLVASIIIRMAN